jgi:6,7-dimethyl-8-ribityllumazine synthase
MKHTAPTDLPANVDASWKIGIISSMWHRDILDAMIEQAQQTFMAAGIDAANITIHDAPGSFEVPLIGAALIDHVDALIGFGIILQGETKHAEALASTTAQAMMNLQVQHKKPFAFEILHVMNIEQAKERAAGPHNKGFEAARAVLWSLSELHNIQRS